MVLTSLVLKIWEELQRHRRKPPGGKLRIEKRIRDEDICKTNFLRCKKVGEYQNLTNKTDPSPYVKQEGGLDTLTSYDAQ